jgi:hypothetical protein
VLSSREVKAANSASPKGREELTTAIRRRLHDELGMAVGEPTCVLPDAPIWRPMRAVPARRQRTTVAPAGNSTPSATTMPVPELPVTSTSRMRWNPAAVSCHQWSVSEKPVKRKVPGAPLVETISTP